MRYCTSKKTKTKCWAIPNEGTRILELIEFQWYPKHVGKILNKKLNTTKADTLETWCFLHRIFHLVKKVP